MFQTSVAWNSFFLFHAWNNDGSYFLRPEAILHVSTRGKVLHFLLWTSVMLCSCVTNLHTSPVSWVCARDVQVQVFQKEIITATHSPASLRNFSFTSAEQSLHVLMATEILSPVYKHTHIHYFHRGRLHLLPTGLCQTSATLTCFHQITVKGSNSFLCLVGFLTVMILTGLL